MSTAGISAPERAIHGLIAAAAAGALFFGLPRVLHPLWPSIVDTLGGDRGTFVYGVFITHMCVLFIGNALFTLLYATRMPFFERFRINPKPWLWLRGPEQRAATFELVRNSIALTLFNNIVIALPMAFLTYEFSLKKNGYTADAGALPSPFTVMWQIAVFMMIEDVVFYANHRLLHSVPFLYKHVHKLHHKYYYSLSYAAEFAHPFEFLVGNSMPFSLGPTLLGAHAYTWVAWTIWRISETIINHSGFDLPFSPFRYIPFTGAANSHDAHHSINTGNYESFFNVLDKFFGTEIPEEIIHKRFGGGSGESTDESASATCTATQKKSS